MYYEDKTPAVQKHLECATYSSEEDKGDKANTTEK